MLNEGGQTVSSSFNIRENKRNVEWLFKQSLNAFELIQHRFNFYFNVFEHGWNGGANRFNIAVQTKS